MTKFCTDNIVNDKLHELLRKGWNVFRTRRNHVKVISPSGALVVVACTPSDHRARQNTLRHIRHAESNTTGEKS